MARLEEFAQSPWGRMLDPALRFAYGGGLQDMVDRAAVPGDPYEIKTGVIPLPSSGSLSGGLRALAAAEMRAFAGGEARALAAGEARALAAGELPNAPVGIERGQFVMSNRVPKVVEEHGVPLATNLEVIRSNPDLERRIAEEVRRSSLVTAKQSRMNPRGVTDAFIDAGQQNLSVLMRHMEPHKAEAMLWYDGAHDLSKKLSGRDLTTNQSSGVIAVLSPQKDWHQNAEMSKQIVEGYRLATKADMPFHDELLRHYADTSLSSVNVALKDKVRAGKVSAEQAQRMYQEASQSVDMFRQQYGGVRFADLPQHAKARMLRALGQLEFGQSYPIISPSGTIGDLARTKAGAPAKMGWNSYPMLEKAVSIIEDGSAANISRALGSEHKVRAFYNNINAPWSPLASTIDTHQVAATHLQPMGGSRPEVAQSMGGLSDVVTGVSGTNPLYQEAMAREAAAQGLIPRQGQSVAWEGLQSLWSSAEKRNKETAGTIARLWNEYRQGRRSLGETQQDVLALTNPTAPKWAR